MNYLQKHVLRLADNALILGQRLSEWCGHGPFLEEDIWETQDKVEAGEQRLQDYRIDRFKEKHKKEGPNIFDKIGKLLTFDDPMKAESMEAAHLGEFVSNATVGGERTTQKGIDKAMEDARKRMSASSIFGNFFGS